FGNNKDFFQAWHWDGDGDVERGPLVGLEVPAASAGANVVEIRKREVWPYGAQPRLDVLCFTKDRDTPPDDAALLLPGVD
ncbi:MAG: hypothetical protein V3R77_08930, partial [Candidatus Binatia bacterium]